MNTINLQDFNQEAAYQVQAVLETISRLGEHIEVYDGERLVGTILRGDPIVEKEPLPPNMEQGNPALGVDVSLEEALDEFAQQVVSAQRTAQESTSLVH